ncbi:ATP-binding protein [Halobaculum sp. MBLA0143]|uniref:ATP-binding protein n=1 Tax=Halobaculum sp. MBLA0143 TaxID=3079933 RepID=UPI00352614EC
MLREPTVNEVNEFLEIASDFEDPLEVIRESLSNAYDAEATTVRIAIEHAENGSDIVVADDGHGMDDRDLASFFDLGNSRKEDSIGYKGHGTKIFYKSDRITVETVHDGTERRAVMDDPWRKLNDRVLPEYEVTEDDTDLDEMSTRIRIENFRSGQGFDPSKLTYNKIEHYLYWKTIVGSTAHHFGDDHRRMQVVVDLDERIDDTRDSLDTRTGFEFPDEQLDPGDGDQPAAYMCKHYPPRELSVEYDGGETTVQMVGMVGGKAARNELPTYGKHSAQFGVWLAKDHIKVERINDTLAHDNEFLHFMFVANCQDIELAANRESIRNKASPVFAAIREEVSYYMSKVANDPWFETYLEARKRGRYERRVDDEAGGVSERRAAVADRGGFSPSNRPELLVGLQRATARDDTLDVTVEDFAPGSEVNALLTRDGTLENAAVAHTLTGLLDDGVPLEPVDVVVCWEQGDPTELREWERRDYFGGSLAVDTDAGRLTYDSDGRHTVDVLELAPYFE